MYSRKSVAPRMDPYTFPAQAPLYANTSQYSVTIDRRID